MVFNSYERGRCFLGRLPCESDLLEEVQELCRKEGITLGVFWALGAVKSARLAYYNQKGHTYESVSIIDEPREMISCLGNISLRDGQPVVHAHVALADEEGETVSGHLLSGTIIFACELFVQELVGSLLIRREDEETGLPLWSKG